MKSINVRKSARALEIPMNLIISNTGKGNSSIKNYRFFIPPVGDSLLHSLNYGLDGGLFAINDDRVK